MRSSVERAEAGRAPSRGRRIAFRIIATVVGVSGAAFGLFTAVFGIISEAQRIHAFHNTVVASLLLILSAPPALPVIVLIGVLWLLRPRQERPVPAGRPSAILLVLVVAAAVPLTAYALTHAELQRTDSTSEHAEFYHWVETSFYAASILLLGLLAALQPAAYRFSAWSAGLALAILGGGSLLLGDYVSALDTSWAWAALAGGIVFVGVAEWEFRRSARRTGAARA